MKIRIKGASVRMRLSRPEVAQLVHRGEVGEETPFGGSTFCYAVQSIEDGEGLSAIFDAGKITMLVPRKLISDWDTNSVIGIDGHMAAGAKQSLYLLLEKDFQCLDQTTEDQSENYLNPNQRC